MTSKLAIAVGLLAAFGAACGGQSAVEDLPAAVGGAFATSSPMGGALAGASSAVAGGGAAAGPIAVGGQANSNAGAAGLPAGGAGGGGSLGSAGTGGTMIGSGTGGGTAVGGTSAGGGSGSAAVAGNGAGGATGAPQPVKGLGFNLAGSSCDDLKTLGLAWFYAWSATSPCANASIEFVPQIWGSWKKLNWVPTPAKALAKSPKYLLGFNEPDGSGQANLTVSEAIALWPDFDQPGVLVGSPAVAGQDNWLPDFMTQVKTRKLRVDFIAIHWYGWDPGSCNDTSALEGKIKWAEQWNRPIWITEWSCRLQSVDVDKKFLAAALVMLKKHPSVERYAWFLSRSTGEFANAALLDGSGKATGIGSEYIAAAATH